MVLGLGFRQTAELAVSGLVKACRFLFLIVCVNLWSLLFAKDS